MYCIPQQGEDSSLETKCQVMAGSTKTSWRITLWLHFQVEVMSAIAESYERCDNIIKRKNKHIRILLARLSWFVDFRSRCMTGLTAADQWRVRSILSFTLSISMEDIDVDLSLESLETSLARVFGGNASLRVYLYIMTCFDFKPHGANDCRLFGQNLLVVWLLNVYVLYSCCWFFIVRCV